MGDEARWEFPTGHADSGESMLEAAKREFTEETGAPWPDNAEQVGTWRSEDGKFQGFVFRIPKEEAIELGEPDGEEISGVSWWDVDDLDDDEIRDKVKDNLDRSEPIMERAEKEQAPVSPTAGIPARPGPGGHREQALVQHHAPMIQQTLASQVSSSTIAAGFGAASGAAAMTATGTTTAAGLAALTGAADAFAATLSIPPITLAIAVLAMWADSWLAGAKDGRDSLDEEGVWVPSDDPLDKLVESIDWGTWKPGDAPNAGDIPGFDDVKQRLGSIANGLVKTTRKDIASAIKQFLAEHEGQPWTPELERQMAQAIEQEIATAARAHLIAASEVNRAFSQGAVDIFKRSNVPMFDLLNQEGACPICVELAAANPHPIADASATPPIHAACRCAVRPVKQ